MAVGYRVLGPLAVTVGGRPVAVGSGRQRSLIAALLLRAGDIVSIDELVEPIWSESLPENPRRSLQTLLARLRHALGPAAGDLETHPHGYRLRVADGALDLDRFLTAVANGRRAAHDGDLPAAADHFAAAMGEWSGAPLADVPSDWLRRHEVPRLDELRLTALEQRYAVELDLGRHDPLIAGLRAQVSVTPLRERFWAQLMRALHASQRQSDALEAYHSVAAVLRDELGIDPGVELQRLHQEILTGHRAPVAGPRPALAQLPPDIGDFVGRSEVVAAVVRMLGAAARGASAVPVVTLCGQPGVGKTTTAVHIAHRLRGVYPDGQIYVQLAGAGPTPRDPADVLADLLRDLGMDGRQLPDGADRRAAAFRARLADRRVLVVLDDAASVSQITPLLPGTASCGVLVTSRRWLGGLASVRSVRLDPLDRPSALALLTATAGPDRVAADRESAERVVAACGNLPLAVRIAGARLGRSPALSLDRFAGRLADDHGRLDELSLGELTVRAGLRLSYAAQPADAQRLLRTLGALGTPAVSAWAVPALLPGRDAEAAVEELTGASLVTQVRSATTGQFRLHLHDLVRLFASELAGPALPAEALATLLPLAIDVTVHAAERMPWPANLLPAWDGAVTPTGDDRVDPSGWLAEEHPFLLHLAVRGAATGHHRNAAVLLRWLTIPLVNQHRWDGYDAAWTAVRDAAANAGDDHVAHRADHAIAFGQTARGEVAAAIPTLERCLEYFTAAGDDAGTAATLNDLGLCLVERGDVEAGQETTVRALALCRRIGDRYGEARALRTIGMSAHGQGDYDRAARSEREALAVAVDLNRPLIEAAVLNSIAVTELALGNFAEAAAVATRAEGIFASYGDPIGVGYQHYLRGIATAGAGDRRAARTLMADAHAMLTAIPDVRGATIAARDLAALGIDDDPAAAARALSACVETFHHAKMGRFESVAARLLAVALDRAGDPDAAKAARARADALEPPGNANTDRLLHILVGVTARI